ncbi:hypothetical protein, partial [Streptococcus agalactiae]|uniref:hypothetical protein n=1 Tax=Streptococcus agalactiae TaxID=1311 RepID=UPI002554E2AE
MRGPVDLPFWVFPVAARYKPHGVGKGNFFSAVARYCQIAATSADIKIAPSAMAAHLFAVKDLHISNGIISMGIRNSALEKLLFCLPGRRKRR